ncbi:hypothetical protein [uncultured Tessaracoccus sp.]|uniref:hypothetical protein n=1 Tax=uncultured Tessaracoccus sp. TaxID=905023 RepID=UPI0025F5DDD4|nr:hypothetical protein [uncultured Tessaracoccus sp.]
MTSRRGEACPDGCQGVHSTTADGVRWCWRPDGGAPAAIDVELRREPPPHLASRLRSDEDFWLAWTRLEVVAKLTDTPVVTLLGAGALGSPAPAGITVRHVERGDAVLCLGRKMGGATPRRRTTPRAAARRSRGA